MAREIKTTHPGIRSFVFLTPEEALKEFGGGFSFVGRPFTPAQKHFRFPNFPNLHLNPNPNLPALPISNPPA